MTDEELITALRMRSESDLCQAAADRIEALVKERDAALASNRGLVRLNEMTEARAQRFEAAIRELKHRWYLGDLQEKDFTAALKGTDHE